MKLNNVQTRSFSPENFTGTKGAGGMATEGTNAYAARELGQGWKISPSIFIRPGQTAIIADIDGPGVINHFWMTAPNNRMRDMILRIYWDGETSPSVEVPAADFFCDGWLERPYIDSKTIKLLPANGYNSYWRMPFRGKVKITFENISREDILVYYQGMYDLRDIDHDEAYFHANWHRANPVGDTAVFDIVEGIYGTGFYVGTYLAIQPNAPGWWGEGEIKFYMDGDDEFPTICGTGTEDYVGGAWNFDKEHRYCTYTTDYLGLPQASPGGTIYRPYQRFILYRWHLKDRIRFHENLRVDIQVIAAGDKFVPLVEADVSGMAVWYQLHPHQSPQISLVQRAGNLGYRNLASYLRV